MGEEMALLVPSVKELRQPSIGHLPVSCPEGSLNHCNRPSHKRQRLCADRHSTTDHFEGQMMPVLTCGGLSLGCEGTALCIHYGATLVEAMGKRFWWQWPSGVAGAGCLECLGFEPQRLSPDIPSGVGLAGLAQGCDACRCLR